MGDRLSELPALTGLRGFAAVWVLFFHVWVLSGSPPLVVPGINFLQGGWFFSVGWAGVDIFFCLSAFLLVLPFAQWRYGSGPRPNTGRYLWRRVLRIYPAYLFQLTVLLVLAALGYGTLLGGQALLAHLFLWFNMGEPLFEPLVGVWFTLPIEFSFYLILPFLAPMIDRRRWPWLLLGAIVLTIASRYLMHLAYLGVTLPPRSVVIERLPGRLDQFVIGMLAGCAFVVAGLKQWRPARPAWWWFAGLLGMCVMCAAIISVKDVFWSGHPLLFFWHGLFSICLVPVLLASAWDSAPARVLLSNRPMRYFGDISFGVYLWHMPILVPILGLLPSTLTPVARFWLLLALVLPATVLIAHLSRRFVELPFLRRKPAHRGIPAPTEG